VWDLCSKYARFKPRLVALFGSYARGDYTDASDIDVLVVADGLPKDPRDAYDALFDPDAPRLSPIGMQTDVFLKKLEEGSTFLLEILEDGKVLCADEEFMRRVKEIYARVRPRFQRRGKLWIEVGG
jgi:predicted nucleotidyltransferase